MDRRTGLLRFLRSMRFTVILIVLLILVSIPSTLIIQGESPDYYTDVYGAVPGGIIVALGMDEVFSGLLFLTVSGLFFLNLASCSVWRLTRELRRDGPGRHGPDVLHLGLMVFVVGAVVSGIAGRESPVVWMNAGDGITLPRGGRFTLETFETGYYDDGRPRSFISTGRYTDAAGRRESVTIEVNSPARLEGVRIYQNSFRSRYSLNLIPRPGSGAPERLEEGQVYRGLAFVSIRSSVAGDWSALLVDSAGSVRSAAAGDSLGEAVISGFESTEITGLRLTRDPGVPLIFASFIPIALGMLMILYEKRKLL